MPEFKLDEFDEDTQRLINGEIDRRVSEAVKTTTTKVTNTVTAKLSEEYESKLNALQEAQSKATATDADKIAALEKALNEQKISFERESLKHRTEQRLRDAGLAPEAVEIITPMLVNASNMSTLDDNLDNFVNVQTAAVAAALEKQKQELASSYSQPQSLGGQFQKPDPNQQFNEILSQTDVDSRYASAQAIQFLFDQQG